LLSLCLYSFFFSDAATTEIYTLSLHDALPIYRGYVDPRHRRRMALHPAGHRAGHQRLARGRDARRCADADDDGHRHRRRRATARSEEHTSELQSRSDLVCRLLLEKKKKKEKKK